MRFQATLLAASAVLASLPAAAQPAPPPPTSAAAPGNNSAPDTEQGETGNDTDHGETGTDTEQGEASSDNATAPAAEQGKETAAEDTADNDDDDDDTPDVGTAPALIPPAVDTLGGHFSVAGSAGLAVPFGELQQNAAASHLMGVGWGFGAELGYGVSRSVVIGAWGQALSLGAGSSCSGCKTTSFAAGPFVRYHLVQGTRFDPWMSAGLGFRSTKIAGAPGGDLSYSGLEWLRLRVGGDWYAFSNFGFGPYMELDAGHYLSRPSQTSGNASAHLSFNVGLRLIVDLPGK
jgi:uncharacterized protein involved in copper resistance